MTASCLEVAGFGQPQIMRSRRVPLIIGSVVVVAVTRALLGLLGGDSPLRAVLGGVLFAVLFVPVFFLLMRSMDRRRRKSLGLSGDSTLSTSNDPICVMSTCTAIGSVTAAADAVEQQMVNLKGRPRRTTGSNDEIVLSAGLGSRLALRLFGIYLSPGRRHMPMRLRVEVRGDGASGVAASIQACSDEGWYLVRPSSFEAEYRRALDVVVRQLREAVSGYSPARD
jgi:hypothetical protein